MNSEGTLDKQGKEFKAIGENGIKIGASLSIAEHIPWLCWMSTLKEDAYAKHEDRRGRLTGAITEEHILALWKSTRGAKQHFLDALLIHQEKYDLCEDTIIGPPCQSHLYEN